MHILLKKSTHELNKKLNLYVTLLTRSNNVYSTIYILILFVLYRHHIYPNHRIPKLTFRNSVETTIDIGLGKCYNFFLFSPLSDYEKILSCSNAVLSTTLREKRIRVEINLLR